MPLDHPLWPAFCEWAKDNGVGDPEKEAEEDWEPWWECFKAGGYAMKNRGEA
jgi:hypothetical protein